MKEITEYNIEELRTLYKSYTLYRFTKNLKNQMNVQKTEKVKELDIDTNNKKYIETKKEPEIISLNTRAEFNEFFRKGREKIDRYWLNATKEDKSPYTIHKYSREKCELYIYKANKEENPNKRKKFNDIAEYYNTCAEVIYWCCGIYDYLVATNEDDEELEAANIELHINDITNKANGKPTLKEVYDFIFHTLRNCNMKEIDMLLGLCNYKDEPVVAHRPSYNKKINKYDKEGNLVATFANRAECIEKEKVNKQALSHVLLGRRQSLNGFVYKEEN